jgi:hypothetical protein
MKFYVALIEINPELADWQVVNAMQALKEEGKKVGNVTYYEVKDEKQYRTAERDFAKQVG